MIFSIASVQMATFAGYFIILLALAALSFRKQRSEKDFLIADRSLNFWLTALSAHASDMSSWLFLGYPALIYSQGLAGAWAAIGLTVCMFFNWHFIAPKIRAATEKTNSLTLNAYFENRFGDTSGSIRLISAAMSILFFTFYISSGLVGMGILAQSLFHLHYTIGISVGLLIVVLYVFVGGYRTVAWIDLFQGFFLLGVIVFIPALLILRIGGMDPIFDAAKAQHLATSLFPDFSPKTLANILLVSLGWGLGYFGQPHIITKFMGIRQISEMYKAKYLGIGWQTLALGAATMLGLIGIYTFPEGLGDPEKVVLQIVDAALSPFFAGLVLCAILASTTNVMAAQILVAASNISEDIYKKICRREIKSSELLWISRSSVLLIGIIAFVIAYYRVSSIYQLVLYSWSGLGASFGPLLIFSLFRKGINKFGAFSGILVGGISSAIWPYFQTEFGIDLPPLIVGFLLSALAIEAVSFLTSPEKSPVEL